MAKANDKRKTVAVQGSAKEYNRRKTTIDLEVVRKIAGIARAIDNELRLKMLEKISEAGEADVKSLYNAMKIEQSVCSQHLAILRRAGLVNDRKDGKKVMYSVNIDGAEYINTGFTKLLKAA